MQFRKRRIPITDVNLIASFLPYRDYKDVAIEDLRYALGRIAVVAVKKNVIYARADYESPLELRKTLEERLPDDTPILRVIPVSMVVEGDVEAVKKAVHELLGEHPPGSFAIRLEARLSRKGREVSRVEAIREIAEGLDRKVDLSSPDIIVLIKPFRLREGSLAAIYVGPPDALFSSVKRGV